MINGALHLPYADADEGLRRAIARLQERAYGSPASTQNAPLHDASLNPQSFMLWLDRQLVSYAGVLTTVVRHGSGAYRASGLSCVATDPDYLRQGHASRVVAAASRHIAASGVDLGVFTCTPALAPLYVDAGGWEMAPDVLLVGSREPGALTSSGIGAVVLLRLFSTRALDNAAALRHGTIDLNLAVGQFW